MPTPKLFLIDAHTLCYRSFFAIKNLTTANGQDTNAVYGFVNTLKKILREFDPHYMAVCFDSGKKTHRQDRYAEYKIQRPHMPESLVSQIPLIKDIVKAYNFSIFELQGYEADDIIATLSQQAVQKDIDVVIVSEDKDMYQLLNDKVKFYSARKDVLYSYQDIKKKLGFDPHRMTDFIGLAGDKSDNIPGVMGVGEVTARKLLNEFGSLEGILENLDNVHPPKTAEKIKDQKEIAVFSKELALLTASVPFQFDIDQLKVDTPDKKKLFALFTELDFKKWAEDFSEESIPSVSVTEECVDQPDAVDELIRKIEAQRQFAFGLDLSQDSPSGTAAATTSLFDDILDEKAASSIKGRILISFGKEEVYVLPLERRDAVQRVLGDEDILKISHDIKRTFRWLLLNGIVIKGPVFDTALAAYLLNPALNAYDLKNLAWVYCKEASLSPEDVGGAACMTYRMYSLMYERLKEKNLLELFETIEMPLAFVLAKMENHGVGLDVGFLNKMSLDCAKELDKLTAELYEMAGEEFNLNSPKQLSVILFEKLKLPVIKKTKTGFSTNEEVLKKLATQHALPSTILKYRQLAKLKSTYIDALPKLVSAKTGCVHGEFIQTGTETGRLSSRHPNLQNMPVRTELGRKIRKAIVPTKKGTFLLSADYSQIELRILAHLSQDSRLIQAFQEEQDIHTFTASLIFDVKEKDVTAAMRDTAKRVNFGIIYGMSAYGLSEDLGISSQEAQDFIDRYFLRYPAVKEFVETTIKDCEEKGYVVTVLNRRRDIPEINNPNMALRNFSHRQAMNTPVQGSAADLIKVAMIKMDEAFEKKKLASAMMITVHDELIFEVQPSEREEVIALVRSIMENTLALSVPIRVSLKAGKNWLEMETLS